MTQATDGFVQALSASPPIYDLFDHADGTNINGLPLGSANSIWSNIGPGVATTISGELTNVGNIYMDFINTQVLGGPATPILHLGAAFKIMLPNAGMPAALIAANTTGASAFANCLHANFGPTSCVLSYCAPGYPAFTVIGQWGYSPLIIGAPYSISMDIDEVAHTVVMNLPDGTTSAPISFPATIIPIYNRFQLGGFSPDGAAHGVAVWSGKSKAEALIAAGRAVPMADIRSLKIVNNKLNWAKIGPISGLINFATFACPGSQTAGTFSLKLRVYNTSAALPAVVLDAENYEISFFSNASTNILGRMDNTYSAPQNSAGITLSGVLTATMAGSPGSPGVITLGYTPTFGGPNAGYVSGTRIQFALDDEGCGGTFASL